MTTWVSRYLHAGFRYCERWRRRRYWQPALWNVCNSFASSSSQITITSTPTPTVFLHRLDVLPAAQPTVSKRWRRFLFNTDSVQKMENTADEQGESTTEHIVKRWNTRSIVAIVIFTEFLWCCLATNCCNVLYLCTCMLNVPRIVQ